MSAVLKYRFCPSYNQKLLLMAFHYPFFLQEKAGEHQRMICCCSYHVRTHHDWSRDPLVILRKKAYYLSLTRPYLDIGEHDWIQICVYVYVPVCSNCIYCLGCKNFTNLWWWMLEIRITVSSALPWSVFFVGISCFRSAFVITYHFHSLWNQCCLCHF